MFVLIGYWVSDLVLITLGLDSYLNPKFVNERFPLPGEGGSLPFEERLSMKGIRSMMLKRLQEAVTALPKK